MFVMARSFGVVAATTAVAAAMFFGACGPEPDPSDVGSTSEGILVEGTGSTIKHLVHLPGDYNAPGNESKRYPTIVFLHGQGMLGHPVGDIKNQGLPKLIRDGDNMEFNVNGVTEKFIVIAPLLEGAPQWYPNRVLPVMQMARDLYRSDPDRIYVTGLSLGGKGTFDAITTANIAPMIAAAAPVAGQLGTQTPCVAATNKIAVWAFHGDNDHTVPYTRTTAAVDAINVCYGANGQPKAQYKLFAGVDHDDTQWDNAYKRAPTLFSPSMYVWFLAQRRGGATQPTNNAPTVAITGESSIPVGSPATLSVVVTDEGNVTTATTINGTAYATGNLKTFTLSIPNLAVGTYDIKVTATDAQMLTGNNTLRVTVTAPSQGKITTAESWATSTTTGAGRLFNEPDATQPKEAWDLPWGAPNATAVINLQRSRAITKLRAYDTFGTAGWTVEVQKPDGTWQGFANTIDLSGYGRWVDFPINYTTQYIRLTRPQNSTIAELEIYGDQ